MSDPGFTKWMDDETNDRGFTPTPGGVLDGLANSNPSSSLFWIMDPMEITTIPGLPQQVYDEAARHQGMQQDARAAEDRQATPAMTNGQPASAEDGEAAIERISEIWAMKPSIGLFLRLRVREIRRYIPEQTEELIRWMERGPIVTTILSILSMVPLRVCTAPLALTGGLPYFLRRQMVLTSLLPTLTV